MDLPWVATPGSPSASPQVNDSTAPFRTLQAAIDAVFTHQGAFHTPNVPTQGIVYALPGIYGPSGSGDLFPILMRDRVNVQGLSTRGCVLRELSSTHALPTSPAIEAFWPAVGASGIQASVVLVDFGTASAQGNFISVPSTIPWSTEAESEELFDGFTLEGGDIQMMFWVQRTGGTTAKPTRARISNCVFDMRHDWQPEPGAWIDGPWLGIEMAKHFTPLSLSLNGYPEQQVLIVQNTFVMASRRFDAQGSEDPWVRCRDGAVGIIDVNDPACTLQIATCEAFPRGVGSPGIYNNLFRTAPTIPFTPFPAMAMLGIDSTDTRAMDALTGMAMNSNAFDPTLVGSTSGVFESTPVVPAVQGSGLGLTLVDCGAATQCPAPAGCNFTMQPAGCTAAPLPVPIVAIWGGGTGPGAGVDPCFVGEYLNDRGQVPPAVAGIFHNDWRLVPNSPLADAGVLPQAVVPGGTAKMFCGVIGGCWTEPGCALLHSMDWDGEVYGNPRIVGGRPDIGADETHGYVVAGSWGNDAISHNNPATNLSPTAAQGQISRRLLLDFNASNQLMVINGKTRLQTASPPNAWTQPPATLTPPTQGPTSLLPDYRTQWIAFGNTGQTPTPWYSGAQPTGQDIDNYRPSWMISVTSQPNSRFCNLLQGDDETVVVPTVNAYFATQLVMYTTLATPVGWTNLQFEYR